MDVSLAYDAQSAVLGSLLLSPEKLGGEIMQRLRPEDFRDPSLRTLFTAARQIWLEQKPLDPVTLRDRTGAAYTELIASVMQATPSAVNWEAYCRIVRDSARLADLQDMAHQVLMCTKAEEARELLLKMQGQIAQRESIRVTSYAEMCNDFFDRMSDKAAPSFLDWGFPALNDALHITQGRFVVLAAESSVGKTALALQIARGLAMSGKRVGFFSLETSAPDAADRLMANQGDVSLGAIKGKRLDAAAIRRCSAEAETMYGKSFDLIEAAGCTVEDIRAVSLMHQYDVVFVDYVQMVQSEGREPSEQVRAVSLALHTMSMQLGCTVIGLSQVTPPPRNQSGKRPELSKDNLRESRQLIHDAEAILILDLLDLQDYSSNRVLKIDKNKDGPCGRLILSFDAAHMRFEYVPPYEDDESRRSRERNEKMDRNREERREKARSRQPMEGQHGFREMDADEGGELPF